MKDKITYSDDINKSSEYFRLAISLLSKQKMSVNPHNYQMGYEYVSGRNQLFNDDLDRLIKQSDPLEENQLRVLYQHYFLQDEAFLEAMRQELRHVISKLLEEFGYSGKQLSNYTQTLHQFVDILDSQGSSSDMFEETQKVIEETNSLEKAQQGLKLQVVDIIAEVDALREELQQVREESKIDALTGIANRKAFDMELDHSILAARETRKPLCLLLLDIDHFKRFNDTYGHLIGDKVLRYVAASFKRNIKGNDFLARFGGEEFVIILPSTSINGAMILAEQIREDVSSGNLTGRDTDTSYGKMMISIGVTQFLASDLPDELVARADKALYLAKERGRNRVEIL